GGGIFSISNQNSAISIFSMHASLRSSDFRVVDGELCGETGGAVAIVGHGPLGGTTLCIGISGLNAWQVPQQNPIQVVALPDCHLARPITPALVERFDVKPLTDGNIDRGLRITLSV